MSLSSLSIAGLLLVAQAPQQAPVKQAEQPLPLALDSAVPQPSAAENKQPFTFWMGYSGADVSAPVEALPSALEDYRVTAGAGVRVVVPMLGPMPIALDPGYPQADATANKQPFESFKDLFFGVDEDVTQQQQVFSFWQGFCR